MSAQDHAFVGSIPEIYDRYMGPMIFEPYALDMARRFAGFEGALLEIAAGTGRATRALAEAAPKAAITATDLNEPMLAQAARTVPAPRVTWRQADVQALPFADHSFDAAVCQFGVMFFPDKAAAHAEVRRVLKPGGRYAFSVWDRLALNEVSQAAQDAVADQLPGAPVSFFSRVPFGYHDEDAIRGALADAGFDAVGVERVAAPSHSPSPAHAALALCTGTPLRGEIEAARPGELQAVVDAVTEALARQFGAGPFTTRQQALVVTAIA